MENTDPARGHVKIDHDFTFDNFTYENGVHYQPCVKVSIYFKKRKEVSLDHFFKHWATVHADLTVASKKFGLYKVQRYIQHHQLPEIRTGLSRLGMKPMDFDGCSTLWFKNWDDFENFFTGPVQDSKLADDCKLFLDDEDGLSIFAGRDVVVYGKGIPDTDDLDGVTEYHQTNGAGSQ